MSLMGSIRKRARCWGMGAALGVVVVVLSLPASARAGTIATIELVPVGAASPSDTVATLPTGLTVVEPGATFVIEVWAQTIDSQGLSSVSATLSFDPTIAVVTGITHTSLFSELPAGTADNVAGLVVGLSGSHLSTCADQVGVSPTWARVAIIDMQAIASGSLVIASADTGMLALGTAICGVGDLSPADVSYGSATLLITGDAIPATSEWGIALMGLLLLTAGTLTITRRPLPASASV